MKPRIKEGLENLKSNPGTYIMHNAEGEVIYVGKAKNLFKRVSQYFTRPQTGKVMRMAQEAEWFDTIITSNEKEALILEMNLIQTYYPKYNILLKDDKHYPYIALRKGNDPYLRIKRNNKDNKYIYFGPFPNSGAAYKMVDLLNKLFPLRKCRTIPTTPCLYYHLGQCLGPCINKNIDVVKFNKMSEEISEFLKGRNKDKYNEIKQKMIEASEQENYELALSYKNVLDSIDHINTKQTVELKDNVDRDVFAYSTRESFLCLSVLTYRHGILLGKDSYVVEEFGDPVELFEYLISQYYQKHELPKEIVINNVQAVEDLSHLLDVNFISASRGKYLDLVEKAKVNADNALDQYFISARLEDDKIALLEELGTILGIKTPYQIDLFDNSHTQGAYPVGAMVSFVNGEPCKKLYRKFKIEHEEARDDLKSMEEVVYRHYKRVKEENLKLTDLILVDGGLNQVKAAKQVIDNLGLPIPVYGLFKSDKHQTKGAIDIEGHEYPIENKKLFFMLTRMQDEIHRFAITYHKSRRLKGMTKSILDDVKGLGMKRKEILLKAYPDINTLKQATINELSQLLPNDVATTLFKKLHENT